MAGTAKLLGRVPILPILFLREIFSFSHLFVSLSISKQNYKKSIGKIYINDCQSKKY